MNTVPDLLARAREGLGLAAAATTPDERFEQAHLAALRAAAALLAGAGLYPPGRREQSRSVWERLPDLDPDLAEVAGAFASSARRRYAIEQGREGATPEQADTLLTQARAFVDDVAARVCNCQVRQARWHPGSDLGRILAVGCPVHGSDATPGPHDDPR